MTNIYCALLFEKELEFFFGREGGNMLNGL